MTIQIIVPDLGESVVEATVSRWLKKAGDPVNAGEAVVVLETDKVDLEVAAQRAGTLASITAPEGSDVAVGAVLGEITEGASAGQAPAEPAAASAAVVSAALPAASAPATAPPAHESAKPATPVAQRMAREQQVDLGRVPASGSRVTKADV